MSGTHLGGLTVLVVGAVQFKKEAGLSNFRYHFLVVGGLLVAVGFLLLVVKCACFRIPLPEEYEDDDDFLNPLGDQKQNGGTKNGASPTHQEHNDHNHHRETTETAIENNKLSSSE